MRAEVQGEIVRNEHGRMRIGRFDVTIRLAESAAAIAHLDRCMAQFEDFCTVTQSVRGSIDVQVTVFDAAGRQIK